MTKLRLSNHDLVIETGRRKNIPNAARFCPFCPELIENEMHFILDCPTYSVLRSKLFDYLSEYNPLFRTYSQKEKCLYLIKNVDKEVAHYITQCFQMRTCSLPIHAGPN